MNRINQVVLTEIPVEITRAIMPLLTSYDMRLVSKTFRDEFDLLTTRLHFRPFLNYPEQLFRRTVNAKELIITDAKFEVFVKLRGLSDIVPRLERLTINQRYIDSYFGVLLTALTNLTKLEIPHAKPSALIMHDIGGMTKLTELIIGANKDAVVLAESLANLTRLQKLDMRHMDFMSSTIVAPSLMKLTALRELRITHGQLNNDMTHFSIVLDHLTNLEVLDLSNNRIGAYYSDDYNSHYTETVNLLSNLGISIAKLCKLETLYLNNNNIDQMALDIITIEFTSLSSLRTLHIGHNNDLFFVDILSVIMKLSNLTTLDIANCEVTLEEEDQLRNDFPSLNILI